MPQWTNRLICVLVVLLPALCVADEFGRPRIVRPPDDRMDYFEVDEALQAVGDAVCAFVRSEDLIDNGDGTYSLSDEIPNLDESFDLPLCGDEPFGDQPAAAFCTGSLIAPDVVVSAGHCYVNDDNEFALGFDEFYFVFDFRVDGDGQARREFADDQVFRGSEVVDRFFDPDSTANDWAIVRLERPAEGRTPLKVRTSGEPEPGQRVMAIGFGYGLPMKFSGNATIQRFNVDGFEADFDIIEGNSGGPIIDLSTRMLEGVLSGDAGTEDYQDNGECVFATLCPGDPACFEDDGSPVFTTVASVMIDAFQSAIQLVADDGGDLDPGTEDPDGDDPTDDDGDDGAGDDGLDECPDDPDKTEEGFCGCGVADIDDDEDGVIDCDDDCLDSPGGADVDEFGCEFEDAVNDDDGVDNAGNGSSGGGRGRSAASSPCGAGMLMHGIGLMGLAGMRVRLIRRGQTRRVRTQSSWH